MQTRQCALGTGLAKMSRTISFGWSYGYLRGQSACPRRSLPPRNFQSQRIQHDLTRGLLHLYGNRLFTGKLLPADVRVKKQLVMAGNNGRGQPLGMETDC